MNAKPHSRPRSLEQEPGSLQEEIWSQFRAVLKAELQVLVEQALEEELTEHLAARSHERTAERRGYRNGHYQRRLLTRHGKIPDLVVPRAEEGGVEFQTLGRYQRRQLEIDKILGQLFLAGISTRRLRQLSEALYGQRASIFVALDTSARNKPIPEARPRIAKASLKKIQPQKQKILPVKLGDRPWAWPQPGQ